MRRFFRSALAVLLLALACGQQVALASIYHRTIIYPMNAGKNKVAWRSFDWRYLDLLQSAEEKGGIRFYYYESARPVAEVAAQALIDEFQRLELVFDYTPNQSVPYFLYSSHLELEQTNIFEVSESTLGVTSTANLKMSLSYWGDFDRYAHVSSHEMVHQFMIQKTDQIAEQYNVNGLLTKMPLWFIEGMAEFYSRDGIDAETRMIIRDLRSNSEAKRPIPKFFDDSYLSYAHTYKLGQARYAYLDERIPTGAMTALTSSYMLFDYKGRPRRQPIPDFEEFILKLLNVQSIEDLEKDWEAWLDREFPREADRGPVQPPPWTVIEQAGETVDDFAVDPSGRFVIYRAIDKFTGTVLLKLMVLDDPSAQTEIIRDGTPEVVSLHFMQRRTFTLGERLLAYAGVNRDRDVLYLQEIAPKENGLPTLVGPAVQIRFPDIVELGDLTISPDQSQMAFVGLRENGYPDVFILDLADPQRPPRQLTDDIYYDVELDWGPRGIILSSNRPATGGRALFMMDPVSGALRQALTGGANQTRPAWEPDGSVVFGCDAGEALNIYRTRPDGTYRITDAFTGIFKAEPTQNGLMGVVYFRGGYRLVLIPPEKQLTIPADQLPPNPPTVQLRVPPRADRAARASNLPPWPQLLPRTTEPPWWEPVAFDLSAGAKYRPFSSGNWSVIGGEAVLTTGESGGGAVVFGDALEDQKISVQFAAYGDIEFTDAVAVYLNQKQQFIWGAGVYHTVNAYIDNTFPQIYNLYREREFGAQAIAGYAFSRFFGVEGVAAVAGIRRFDFTDVTGTLDDEWEQINGGTIARFDVGVKAGFDSLEYHIGTGPVSGLSLLAFADYAYFPEFSQGFGDFRFEGLHYLRIWRGMNLMTHLGIGTSSGGGFGTQYLVSSIDTLRGFEWGMRQLYGENFILFNEELQFPLAPVMPNSPIRYLEGVLGFDAGSIFNEFDTELINEHRLANVVVGFNIVLGPLVLRFHYGKPVDIGGYEPGVDLPDDWVNNFSIRYFFD